MTAKTDSITDALSTPLTLANVQIRNRAFLAPMSGVTDLPTRTLAWKHGAGLVVSEMVASQALMEGRVEMQLKLMRGNIPVHVVQLAGREARWMKLAAKMAEAQGADIIDINMGCPAKRVTTGYSGSALMRDLDHAMTLIDAVVGAVKVPVTLKMRLGWDDQSINAPELATRAASAGMHMITVHGRTRCQFYKGTADWEKIRAVRKATKLPLVVNGDIRGEKSACDALKASGADAIMIGRGAYGAPWLMGQLAGVSHDLHTDTSRKGDLVIEHYEHLLSFYGIEFGVRQARKHLSWYLDGIAHVAQTKALRRKILTSPEPQEVIRLIREAFTEASHVPQSRAAA